MNEKWIALAAQIAEQKRQIAELTARCDVLAHQLKVRTAQYDEVLHRAEGLQVICRLHDAQMRNGIITINHKALS